MAPDLTGLQRTAARFGLTLRARVVPPSPRAAAWFVIRGDELIVSERVLERLRPQDAEALLVLQLVRRRRLRRELWSMAGAALACGAVAAAGASLWPDATLALVAGALVLAVFVCASLWSRASLAADDEALSVAGDADAVVRAMNTMNQDEIHVAGTRLAARPDIRARAERLVRVHQLRLPPEMRHTSCPLPGEPFDGAPE